MSLGCGDLDRALQDPELMAGFEPHLAECAECAREVELWREISRVAPALHEEWESPGLSDRIQADLERESRPPKARTPVWTWAVAACAVAAMGAVLLHPWHRVPPTINRELLTERTLEEVQRAEKAYRDSIARLSQVAAPELKDASSPVAAAYREKLMLLDEAIAEAAANVAQNRYNTYLRAELGSLYREKQKTLEDWMRYAKSN